MHWLILLLFCLVFGSLSRVFQRKILAKTESAPIAYSIFSGFLCVGMLLIVWVIFPSVGSISIDAVKTVWWSILLMAPLYGAATIFLYKSLKQTEVSVFAIIFSSKTFFAILASSLLLGETLGAVQFVGVFLIFAGIILVNLKSNNKLKFHFRRGELYALMAAMLYGFANTNDRYLLGYIDPLPELILAFLLATLFVVIVYPREIRKVGRFTDRKIVGGILGYSSLYVASALIFLTVLQFTDNSSQVVSVVSAGTIMTVLLSIVILKERDNIWRKLIAAILAVIGVLLIVS